LLLAAFIKNNWRRHKWPLLIFLAVILFQNGTDIYKRVAPGVAAKNLINESSNFELLSFLGQQNISTVYADRWLSDRLVFLSKDRVIASPALKQRMPWYGAAVNASRDPAFVFNAPGYFEEGFRAAGGGYQKKIMRFDTPDHYFNYYLVLYDFKPPMLAFKEIDPEDLTVTGNTGNDKLPAVFDRDIGSTWSTGRPMLPGDFILVDLKRAREMAKIEMMPIEFSELAKGTLGSFQVLGSADGRTFQILAEVKDLVAPVFWSGPHPFFQDENGRICLALKPAAVRFLKIVQTKESRRNPWTIRELFLYEASARPAGKKWPVEELLGFIKPLEPSQVIADYWLSSAVTQASAGKIRTVKTLNELPYEEKISQKGSFRDVTITPGTVFVIQEDEAAALEKILKNVCSSYKKSPVGGWLVYHQLKTVPGQSAVFFWNGTHLLKIKRG
jgi:hypothetical protein